MGKSTISMAIFHCYVSSPEGNLESQVLSGKAFGSIGKKTCFSMVAPPSTICSMISPNLNLQKYRGFQWPRLITRGYIHQYSINIHKYLNLPLIFHPHSIHIPLILHSYMPCIPISLYSLIIVMLDLYPLISH